MRAPDELTPSPAPAPFTGIALMCVAVVTFAITDTLAKWLSGHINVFVVVWARYVVHFACALVVFNPWTVPGLMRTSRPLLQVARSTMLFLTTALNFTALQFLQLDQTVSIMFSVPFFVALFAGPILGEHVGFERWMVILVGFAGILLVVRPGAGGIHPAAILSVGAAASYALYAIATRMLARTDSSQTTLFYTSLVGTVAASVPLPFVWETPHAPAVLGALVGLGMVAGFGHFLLILAHKQAPAATLAPYIYTQILSMVLLGWMVFGQVPNLWTLCGAGIVIASGIYLLFMEARGRRA